jgi:hypothetical protein
MRKEKRKMRANIPKLPMGAVKIFPDMSDADVRAWNRTEAYRMREYEAMANAMLISMLYVLATKRGHGAQRLREDWEWMIEARAEARRDLRVQMGTYQLAATGKNVEDYFMREELRKKGCDLLAWEKGVEMDVEGNVSFAAWDGGRRK